MNLENSLLQIRDNLLAGKASFETDEENILYNNFASALKTIIDDHLFSVTSDVSNVVFEIFEAAINAELSKNLMASMPVDIFFFFGEYINKPTSVVQKNLIHSYLDNFRYSQFLKKIYHEKRWAKLVEELIRKSNFNFRVLFSRHAKEYSDKTLFKIITGKTTTDYSWNKCEKIITNYSNALINILTEVNEPDGLISF